MLKRLSFTLAFMVFTPIIALSILTVYLTAPYCLLVWIISGDENFDYLDFIFSPVVFFIKMPYRITKTEF